MAEVPGEDEALSHTSSNPFDASNRDNFPSFMAVLANEQSAEETEEQDGSALDWSIDTLAELNPVAFSPLPQQKDAANTSETPHESSGFFEDENQYEVLRTPLCPAARPSRETTSNMTAPAPPLELHRRRRETPARCESALQDPQCDVNRLQAVLPPPTPHWRSYRRATPPSRFTPPRPAKRSRCGSAVTPISEWKSPAMRPPKWSASPIGMLGNTGRQPLCSTPSTLHFDAMTPSPLVRNTTPKQSSKLRLSFGLSPITFPSPQVEEKIEEEKSYEDKLSNEDTLPLSSTQENSAQPPQMERDGRQEESSSTSHSTLAPARMRPPMEPARRRQQAFLEAMDAVA